MPSNIHTGTETALDRARLALRALLLDERVLLAAGARLDAEEGSRCWVHLTAAEHHDAWLIAWGAHSELEPHDHGGSAGVFHLLRGCLIETYRDPDERAAYTVREIGRGQSIEVPAARVHDVHNPSRETALSVHVYSPTLRPMRYFPMFFNPTTAGAR